jgi:hypothetical protein
MHINLSSNIAQVIRGADRFSSQVPFAVASALTATAKEIQREMPSELQRDLDKPTDFTQRGFYIEPARKERLQASVGVKAAQAEYLRYQVQGGVRPPKRKALRLPSVVQLDSHGNMPAGLVRQLVTRAKAGKRATKAQARRFGVSQAVDLFYGEPGDGRPAGIYKRVVTSSTVHRLVPVVVMPKQSARYERRFDFYAKAKRTAERVFVARLDQAWRRALATAR